MKPHRLILLCALTFAAFQIHSQPTSSAPAQKAPTQIFSDTVDFDLGTHVAVYRGNVRVDDPQMRLWCDLLTATAPAAGGRIESIIAETNVILIATDDKGETNRATGDKLVYTYKVTDGVTNELAVLTGNPMIEKPDVTISGDVIEWDRANNKLLVKNQRMVFRTEEAGVPTNKQAGGVSP
ncbi:MAG TPA: LptA/OstA family protein [Verrucomicrobiota bacterium]|nr:LptA/OstA family protein [Verrucomicrobiota bacterium]